MKFMTLLSACALSCLAVSSPAAKLGDAAPPIKVKTWIQGKPVAIQPGQVTVIEFWATWCPPCRTSIPHINKIQDEYKDKGVVVVGVSNEAKRTVESFVKKMGDKMTYRVVIGDDSMYKGYMSAFNVRGIPYAFVVDAEGRIAWHGHHMGGMDAAIKTAVDTRDAAKAEKEEAAAE